ncbi:ABA4-like family protein [Novosphingobium sp.]|uniref:ABA4-like family protein n=1 Tax=Novosphingobium sp. TaxID=1874826 RepID=UPI0025FA283C|nr:ABA4-like family protein [Novosphingobium sp.]
MWAALFSLTNLVAVAGWIVLVALPRAPLARSFVMYGCVGLLCLTYAVLMALMIAGAAGIAQGMDSYTIAGIRGLFSTDGGIVIGWTHYLAFDLFTGLWIASDADNKGYSRLGQTPFLLVTFLVGPVGLVAWLLVRERRARAAARDAGSR